MKRRGFLQTVALAPAAAGAAPTPGAEEESSYPRRYRNRQLAMIAFPLGGIAAGSISLGGRGQLHDWEIFNRPDKGLAPPYALASIWARQGNAKPVARVLESRVLPPFEGSTGLGSNNAPGLPRLRSAIFTGEYPLARIDFADSALPVAVSLEAFTPFFPLDADDSGMPLAVLRYRVRNPGAAPARVSIAFSLDNPVGLGGTTPQNQNRQCEIAQGRGWQGLVMTNPGLAKDDVLAGSFVLGVREPKGNVTAWRGWPKGRWWNSPMLFWDQFRATGSLDQEPADRGPVGSLCLQQEIGAGGSAEYSFLLAWHFPNRTPERCGWRAPKGSEKAIIGNWYAARWPSASAVLDDAAPRLPILEAKTRAFAAGVRESTLPAKVKEAAMANLSTLVTQTCFRTADGEFHGFEGSNDKSGCCYGSCTHVWNYETATAHLFPSLARSLRHASFGFSQDDTGAQHFRQVLPDGQERSTVAAADGQMGQIMKVYLDWRLTGDTEWLRRLWPRVQKALAFAWIPGGWDSDTDGVLEGVQHNTYDVEFYGPNPQCGVYYLGALRAAEEMAKALGDAALAARYRDLFQRGSRWIDANLFNGEYYVQHVRGVPKDRIAPSLLSSMGSENTLQPEYQVGEGCLIDQLIGQYQAYVCGLGPLLDRAKIRRATESIYRYNYKRNLSEHESVQRIFALNNESALVICDYGKATRPHIPFPYYAEVMTGFEYAAAAQMIWEGMEAQGIECIGNIRSRYDGESRNPWNEAECGHHYARAMAAWSPILALSGFLYHAPSGRVTAKPRLRRDSFRSFWSCGSAWGEFSDTPALFSLTVREGDLWVSGLELHARSGKTSVRHGRTVVTASITAAGDQLDVKLASDVHLRTGETLTLRAG